ncbi:hypothetical protein BC829DRAFT_421020 [Chytridium lagenaria]|nr:hypothetical protein BC829DRAFT_421020 [Chytridium lagenaria]
MPSLNDDDLLSAISLTTNDEEDAPLRIPKRYREGTRRDMIPKRIAAAHKAIEQKEGMPIHEVLMVDEKGQPDPEGDNVECSKSLCVLNVGGSSYGADLKQLEEWIEELEGFVDMIAGKGKAYTFLMFSKAEFAHAAVEKLHKRPLAETGRICLAQKARKVPISLADITIEDPEEIAKLIPGLIIIPDFITEEEEKETTKFIALSNRKVQHYGVIFDYTTNYFGSETFDKFPSLPSWTDLIVHRLHTINAEYLTSNQLTINYYPPGSGIRPHVDTHSSFDGPVVSVSLNAPSVMEFRYLPPPPPVAFESIPEDQVNALNAAALASRPDLPQGFQMVNVLLPRRSVALMTGESRFGWEHSIGQERRM